MGESEKSLVYCSYECLFEQVGRKTILREEGHSYKLRHPNSPLTQGVSASLETKAF
jgi:hypothetical protein